MTSLAKPPGFLIVKPETTTLLVAVMLMSGAKPPASMMVVLAETPVRLRLLVIVKFPPYIPLSTSTVSPGLAASIAD